MFSYKKYGLLFLFVPFFLTTNAQNWIGMHKDSILRNMIVYEPRFKLDRGTVNKTYKYLKYVDDINECTKLFFISGDNKCSLIRLMCSYSNLDDVMDEINRDYIPVSKNTWMYVFKGQKYKVELEKGDWFFTVTTKKYE